MNSGKNPGGAGFFSRVYDIVARIPAGRVVSYGQLAFMAGKPRAARLVGQAMSKAPSGRDLPCHRVVSRDGRLSPGDVFGGEGVQRFLLESEGVAFLPNGCIDMDRHLWRFDAEDIK